MTAVVREDGHALDIAETIVVETYKMMGFDPKEMFGRLGIDTDLATSVEVRILPSDGATVPRQAVLGTHTLDAVPPFATFRSSCYHASTELTIPSA